MGRWRWWMGCESERRRGTRSCRRKNYIGNNSAVDGDLRCAAFLPAISIASSPKRPHATAFTTTAHWPLTNGNAFAHESECGETVKGALTRDGKRSLQLQRGDGQRRQQKRASERTTDQEGLATGDD
ncbi:hypothetical protein Dda_0469 [Drechslerella dactyloides]|uniref:Uncharacterized protein n=1 Tax=Drechslerella dactyloides TaxID=74499 RepID=A0AAD6NMP2_DREDA|nr:hypothetical protein Dda_0469 [Drechslerella dactyloides]